LRFANALAKEHSAALAVEQAVEPAARNAADAPGRRPWSR
jgi:hypothetical protein